MMARKRRPMSEQPSFRGVSWLAIVIGLLFIAIAGVGAFTGFLFTLFAVLGAQQWNAVDGRIRDSAVVERDGAYRADIAYTYEVDGGRYMADRVFFGIEEGSAYDLVDRYPAGAPVTVYVNPSDPQEAVLERRLGEESIVTGIVSAVFIAAGIGLVGFGFRFRRFGNAPRTAKWEPAALAGHGAVSVSDAPFMPATAEGEVELKESAPPLAKLIIAVIIGLIWNGITWTAAVDMLRDGISSDWFGVLFMVPFLAVGFAIIGAAFYFGLAMTNARPVIRLPRNYIVPGETLQLEWSLSGNVAKVERISISLEGKESATYRRGTRTVTDTHSFLSHPLITVVEKERLRNGELSVSLPASLMHTFEASNNKITYAIKVHGTIPKWPDIHAEFAVVVAPASR